MKSEKNASPRPIRELAAFIYGAEQGPQVADCIAQAARIDPDQLPPVTLPLSQRDAVLISYGDSLLQADATPLASLCTFCQHYLHGLVSALHILPFNPYTSDDGFSVSDYLSVNPQLGDWPDFDALAQDFDLMFDLVLNHCSQRHHWFQQFLSDHPHYRNYFIEVDPQHPQLSKVFRPRALPLVHRYQGAHGPKYVWTTFSEDQVDLNFAHFEVLVEFVKIMTSYLRRGFRLIRLDAVGFAWKELGTSCIHHAKTHALVQLLRSVACLVQPQAVLITETNVPHQDNVSYFGNGSNEAQMVYQFALPPLTLDAFLRGDAQHLTHWASTLQLPSPQTTFFNFLASHDGIGVLAARDYLSEQQMENMLEQVKLRGGYVSYKSTEEGEIPYELNISYADAIAETSLPLELRVRKFLSSQAIMLAMAGIPGIYIHSLLGSPNWREGSESSGIKRRINRRKLELEQVELQLQQPHSFCHQVFNGFRQLLQVRKSYSFFAPQQPQTVLHLDPRVFALVRGPESEKHIICFTNVSGEQVDVLAPAGRDLLSGSHSDRQFSLPLQPYQTVWWLQA